MIHDCCSGESLFRAVDRRNYLFKSSQCYETLQCYEKPSNKVGHTKLQEPAVRAIQSIHFSSTSLMASSLSCRIVSKSPAPQKMPDRLIRLY